MATGSKYFSLAQFLNNILLSSQTNYHCSTSSMQSCFNFSPNKSNLLCGSCLIGELAKVFSQLTDHIRYQFGRQKQHPIFRGAVFLCLLSVCAQRLSYTYEKPIIQYFIPSQALFPCPCSLKNVWFICLFQTCNSWLC